MRLHMDSVNIKRGCHMIEALTPDTHMVYFRQWAAGASAARYGRPRAIFQRTASQSADFLIITRLVTTAIEAVPSFTGAAGVV